MPKNLEHRKNKDKTRSYSAPVEFRELHDDGTFEGYLTVWGSVDDYNSTFQRGAFKKTIQERGQKVKIFYDHEHLIGAAVELREDDHGLYGKGKLNLSVDKAKEAYSFMKDGTLEGLSFGFRTIKEGFSKGVRQIKEVQLFEFGPVTFPASEEALITDVRSQDFSESLDDVKLQEERDNLSYALHRTLSDVWWADDTTADNVIGKLDSALADYHASYLDFASRWVARFWTDEQRTTPFANDLETAFINMLDERKTTIDKLALDTTFTKTELQELRQGNTISNRVALGTLSDDVNLAHREQRNKAVEALCLDIRESLTDSEKLRIATLLKPTEKREIEPDSMTELMNYFKEQSGE